MRYPIQFQFMGPMLIASAASLAAIAVLNARSASQQTKAQIEQQLQGVLGVLANSNFPLTNRVLAQMGDLAGAELILAGDSGSVVASSHGTFKADDLPATVSPPKSIRDIRLAGPLEIGGSRYYHAAARVPNRFEGTSSPTLHVLFPQGKFNTAWQQRFLPPLLVGVATLGVVGLLTHLVAARIGRVLRRLQHGVRLLAAGGFETVTTPALDDEIRDLAEDVNQTAERLQAYEAEVRDTERLRMLNVLGSGLAHEMRNAATGCRLAIDLHGEELGDRPELGDCLEVARGQLKLIEKRLSQFLQMTDKPPTTHLVKTDPNDVVAEVFRLMEPSARHSGVRLDWQPTPVGRVLADSDQLTQVVMNLALNALDAAAKPHAADKPAYVRAEIDSNGEGIELRIADSGAGPSEAVADRLFDSFVTDKPEGIGLGLAVARRVVTAHGGELSWCRKAGETQFLVRLPAARNGEVDG